MKFNESISLLRNDIHTIVARKIGININNRYYKDVCSIQDANECIRRAILDQQPRMIARCGTVECQAVYKYLHDKNHLPCGAPILPVLCH